MRFLTAVVMACAVPASAAEQDSSWYWEAGSVPALPAFVLFTAPRVGRHGVGNFIGGVSRGGLRAADGQLLVGKTGLGVMAQNDPHLAQKFSLRLFDTVQPVLFTGAGVRVQPSVAVSVNAGRSFWFRQRGYWHVWMSVSVGGR